MVNQMSDNKKNIIRVLGRAMIIIGITIITYNLYKLFLSN